MVADLAPAWTAAPPASNAEAWAEIIRTALAPQPF
ncbi:hypothetical protein K353_06160 [Kitasatospora sp. SolWspMP-SS2h]|nr:hypothetical protein K353_06160 [Kitasatospora sp. SolWspMP-SS2h]